MSMEKLEWIGKTEAARLLGVSRQRVHQLAEEGRIPSIMTSIGRIFEQALIMEIAEYRAARSPDLAGNSSRNWPEGPSERPNSSA